jgi:hypothetical protein
MALELDRWLSPKILKLGVALFCFPNSLAFSGDRARQKEVPEQMPALYSAGKPARALPQRQWKISLRY